MEKARIESFWMDTGICTFPSYEKSERFIKLLLGVKHVTEVQGYDYYRVHVELPEDKTAYALMREVGDEIYKLWKRAIRWR